MNYSSGANKLTRSSCPVSLGISTEKAVLTVSGLIKGQKEKVTG